MRSAFAMALVLVVALAAGCSASPTRATMDVAASPGLNPNRDGQPSPTVVRIYELKSLDAFNQASFFELFDKDMQRLAVDLLNRRELEVKPGQAVVIEREADPAARYIGVIAGYRSVTDVTWRSSVALEVESRNTIIIKLDPLSLTMTKRRRGWLGLF